jgi:hypothetical protein
VTCGFDGDGVCSEVGASVLMVSQTAFRSGTSADERSEKLSAWMDGLLIQAAGNGSHLNIRPISRNTTLMFFALAATKA